MCFSNLLFPYFIISCISWYHSFGCSVRYYLVLLFDSYMYIQSSQLDDELEGQESGPFMLLILHRAGHVASSEGYLFPHFIFCCIESSLLRTGFSLQCFCRCRAQAPGPRASVVAALVACGLRFSVACGIFLDQVWNPCPLHWQADSWPSVGSPHTGFWELPYGLTVTVWLIDWASFHLLDVFCFLQLYFCFFFLFPESSPSTLIHP